MDSGRKTLFEGEGHPQRSDSTPEASTCKLRDLPDYLRAVAHGMPISHLLRRTTKGGFSLVEHACHLRDYEKEGVFDRIQRILVESVPDLPDFEGEKLAIERNYRNQSFTSAVEDFSRNRARSLELIRRLSDKQMERTACLGTRGVVSIGGLIEIVADHDRIHRQEIAELLEEVRNQGIVASAAGAIQ